MIQHPLGETLKLASGRYDSRESTRLRYRVDTEPGSSGSPCFTAQMDLVALHRGSAEGLANQGVPFDAIAQALPPGFFPAAHREAASSSDDVIAVETMPADAGASARPRTEAITAPRRRWSPRLVAAGATLVMALAAVPVWLLFAGEPTPPVRPSTEPPVVLPQRPAVAAPAPTPTRRPVREVTIPFTATPLPDDAQCRSDASHQRALFRLESQGPWPAAGHPRTREVQMAAVGEVEIDDAVIAAHGGVAVTAVAVTKPRLHAKVGVCRRRPDASRHRGLRQIHRGGSASAGHSSEHMEGGRTMRGFWSSWLLVAMVGAWACGGSNTPSG